MSFAHVSAPSTGVTKSRAFATTSSWDLDDCNSLRQQALQFLLGGHFHLGALALDRRILHASLIVRCLERDGPIEQHDGNQVLQAKIGTLDVIDLGSRAGGETYHHLLHLIGLERVLLAKVDQRVERRLDRSARAPFLDDGLRHLIAFAELIDQTRRISLRGVGIEEVFRAGKDVAHPGPARSNQQRSGNSVAGSHGAKHKGLLHMLGIPLPDRETSPRLLRRVVEQPAHLLGVQTSHAAAGSRGAEGPNHIVGVLEYGAAQHRFHRAHSDIVPKRHSAQEVRPVDAECLGEGKCSRHDGAPRVGAPGAVVVVGLVGLRQRPVHDSGFERSTERIGGNNRCNFLAAIGVREPQCLAPGRQLGPRDHGGQSVEDVVFCFLHHRIRNRAALGFAHIGAEPLRHRADRFSCCPRITRECSGGSEA